MTCDWKASVEKNRFCLFSLLSTFILCGMESNGNLDLTLKCLGHVVFGGESTQRVIEPTGENLREWNPLQYPLNFRSAFNINYHHLLH